MPDQVHALAAAIDRMVEAVAQGVVAEWKQDPILQRRAGSARGKASLRLAKSLTWIIASPPQTEGASPAERHPSSRPVDQVLTESDLSPDEVTKQADLARKGLHQRMPWRRDGSA